MLGIFKYFAEQKKQKELLAAAAQREKIQQRKEAEERKEEETQRAIDLAMDDAVNHLLKIGGFHFFYLEIRGSEAYKIAYKAIREMISKNGHIIVSVRAEKDRIESEKQNEKPSKNTKKAAK